MDTIVKELYLDKAPEDYKNNLRTPVRQLEEDIEERRKRLGTMA